MIGEVGRSSGRQERGIIMAWQPKEPPEISGPLKQKKCNTTGSGKQSSPPPASKSTKKANPQKIPDEILEGQKRLLAKREAIGPTSPARPRSGDTLEMLERMKAKAIERGTWNQEPPMEATPKAAPGGAVPKKSLQKKWSEFRKKNPKVFRTPGVWEVYAYVFFGSKKKESGLFRWEGYIRQVAESLGRSYCQTRLHFEWLEAAGIFFRWNTGKKFPANIASGSGPAYAFTVVTVMPSPKALARAQIAAVIDAKKKAGRKNEKKPPRF